MSYAKLINFGPNKPSFVNNPLSYCLTSDLDNSFIHKAGERTGRYSKPCQMFMSDYCSKNWNQICEVASQDADVNYANSIGPCFDSGTCGGSLSRKTQGDMLIRNTAAKKYLVATSAQCNLKYQPFDPQVPTSPMIAYWDNPGWTKTSCIPVYEVNPSTIDNDPVMNKILNKPEIALDILVNIHNTAQRLGKMESLQGTKLHNFFKTPAFQTYVRKPMMG